MTEEEARAWIHSHFPLAERPLERYVELLLAESDRQNLIAPSTRAEVWARHIVDSAQLVRYAPAHTADWLDIGSGAGLPGLVIALITQQPIELVEPRRRRADFLQHALDMLGARHARVVALPVERTPAQAVGAITARAVASLDKLFDYTSHRCGEDTVYLLPKGTGAIAEIESARATWHAMFHVEQSITRPDSLVVVARGVSRCTA